MPWTFSQSSGAIRTPNGALLDMAYAGRGPGLLNPGMQNVPDVGPIPQGKWTIEPAEDLPHLGPLAMALTPARGTDTFGRSGFYIHGDNAAENHTASCGCIVASHDVRAVMAASADRVLQVTTT